jgi:mycofactocin system glycosyltransferase
VRTPYVAFVDSDVQVDGSDLLRLARHFADPAVVLVGPRVLGHTEGGRPNWYERYENRDSSLTLGTRAGIVRPGAAVAWLPSACLVARTGSLGAGFDGALRVGEDVDLVWRLGEAGHRIRYDPAVEARHETRGSVRDWLARKAFYGKGSAVLAARHGDCVAPAVLSPPYALAAAAALTRHRVAVPLVLAALARGHRAVAQALPSAPGHERLAARIAARGFGWAARQEASLLLRHWWPAAAGAAIVSRSARRALLTALAVDLAVVVRETPGLPTRDLPAHFVARRLDDLAYGAGLWSGAVRGRCVTPLRPRWTGRPRIR